MWDKEQVPVHSLILEIHRQGDFLSFFAGDSRVSHYLNRNLSCLLLISECNSVRIPYRSESFQRDRLCKRKCFSRKTQTLRHSGHGSVT